MRSNPLVGKVLVTAEHPWLCDTLVRLGSKIPTTNVGAVHRAVCPACLASAPFMTQPGQERVNRPPCELQLLIYSQGLVGGVSGSITMFIGGNPLRPGGGGRHHLGWLVKRSSNLFAETSQKMPALRAH